MGGRGGGVLGRTGGPSVPNLLSVTLLHGFYPKIWACVVVYMAVC